MTVIDLGELGRADEQTPSPRPPRSGGRPLRLALVALLALLSLAGAVPGPRPPVRLAVPAGPEPGQLLSDLLVRAVPTSAASARELVAVGLADGRVRWRSPLPAGHQLALVDEVGGNVVVTSDPGGEPESALLDHDSGRVRWRQPGVAVPTRDGGLLLEKMEPDRIRVRGVDPGSGAVRWSATAGAGTLGYRYDDRGVAQVVLITNAGRVEVRDSDTGRLGSAFQVPPARGPAADYTQVAGDVLLTDGGPGQVAAYDLDTGDLRWRTPVDPANPFARACGGGICVAQGDTGTRVLDPSTGRVRWTDDRWSPAWPLGDQLLAIGSGPGGDRESFALLDPATGRMRVELGPWQPISTEVAGGRLVEGRMLTVRPLSGGRMLLGELDLGTGEVRPLDVLPGGWDFCTHRGRAVTCWGAKSELGLWRLPG
ncbi:PQQ-binding-like beta-propeller repeat protein [Micromonospora sp. URMC 105]|uniref:outer membrane protein assembly factor BamB family protein n=1 Tax=Micromonospora sp. URMC 105 TaxID=3423413 RepID=UPI003F1A837F